jgi:hypothetical protein
MEVNMKKWILLLTGLLSVQIVLAVTLQLSSRDYNAFEATEKLLSFEVANIDHINIEDNKSRLVIAKQNDTWVLPENDDFPVAATQVDALLESLSGLQKGLPVATSEAALGRFKVAPDQFERKLILSTGEQQVAQLLVGSSAGFRKAHVRPVDEEAVYSVEFNSWDVGANSADWIDKTILQLDEAKVRRVDMPDFSLARENGKFSLVDQAEKEEADSEAMASLLNKLTTLRVDDLANSEEAAIVEKGAAKLEIKVALSEGESLLYRFWEPEKESYFLLKRSDQQRTFKVAKQLVEALSEMARDKLVLKLDEASPATSDEEKRQDATSAGAE